MKAMRSSETSVLTKATQSIIQDGNLDIKMFLEQSAAGAWS
jgi:hypothetical protein